MEMSLSDFRPQSNTQNADVDADAEAQAEPDRDGATAPRKVNLFSFSNEREILT